MALVRFLFAISQGAHQAPLRDIRVRDVRRASDGLNATYFIRLFAEAEAGLRSFWRSRRDTDPPAIQLLDSIAAIRGIPVDLLAAVQQVRQRRNELVHKSNESGISIDIEAARSRLCQFLSRLPPNW